MESKPKTLPLKVGVILACLMASQLSRARTEDGRAIRKITIEKVGQNLDKNDVVAAMLCPKFRPTEKSLRDFFLKAYPAPSVFMNHDRYSPCYAEGTISFNDSKSFGSWRLYSSGTAVLSWDFGGGVHLMRKTNKWYDPFACTYGLSDEPEC